MTESEEEAQQAVEGQVNTSLAEIPNPPPGPMTLRTALAQAQVYLASGLLPDRIKSPAAAVVIMAVAKELGVKPLAGLRLIYVVDGVPSCSSQLILAMIRRDYGRDALRLVESNDEQATVEAKDGDYTQRFTWTIEDARRAKLLGKDNWQRYPRAMLRARAITEAARAVFPESLGGLYALEEMDPPPMGWSPDD